MSTKSFYVSKQDYDLDSDGDGEVEIELSEIWEEIDAEEFEEQSEERGYTIVVNSKSNVPKLSDSEEFKRIICDLLEVSYLTKPEDLIKQLIEKLDNKFFEKRDDEALLYLQKYEQSIEQIKVLEQTISNFVGPENIIDPECAILTELI